MKIYTIKNNKYYLASDLMQKHPTFFKGCKNNRGIIARKKDAIEGHYLFARKDNDKWIKTDGSSRKLDKLFISKKWFNEIFDPNQEDKIEMAPKVIHLEEHEMFYDNNGNPIEIEVRGEREFDKCYFKVKDIMDGFGLKSLHNTITNKEYDGYREGTHYKYFYPEKSLSQGKKTSKKLYLTYSGLMRVLFSSNKDTAEKFLKWASKTLFAAQMGTTDQKHVLIADTIGVSIEAIKAIFNKSATSLPVIYLFYLGIVKDLRKSLKIPDSYGDDEKVYKWGMTEDLIRRTKEHQNTFSKISGCQLELFLYGYIDPLYVAQAETDIKHIMEDMDMKLIHEKYAELAIISNKQMRTIKKHFGTVSKIYRGHSADLIQQIRDKEMEIELLKRDGNRASEKRWK